MQIKINVDANANKVFGVVQDNVKRVFHQVMSRGTRASIALRNAELRVLSGERSGRVYQKPNTNKTANKKKIKFGTYRASAPGEPPAVRTGDLRRSFRPSVGKGDLSEKNISIQPGITSHLHYATHLEYGTKKNGKQRIAPRPFRDKIIEEAKPDIIRIYSEPYL